MFLETILPNHKWTTSRLTIQHTHMHGVTKNATCNKAEQHLSHSMFMCFPPHAVPLRPSASIPHSVLLSLCPSPIYYPFCSTVYSININKYSCCVSSSLWLVLPARTQGEKLRNVPQSPIRRPFLESVLFCFKEVGVAIMCFCWVYVLLVDRDDKLSRLEMGTTYGQRIRVWLLDRMRASLVSNVAETSL